MALPDHNVLTSLLNDFKSTISPATGNLTSSANTTLRILVGIDLTLGLILNLLDDEDAAYKLILRNTFKYGVFVYLILSYNTIVNQIISSFQSIGLIAAGNTLSASDITNPSLLCQMGLDLTANLFVAAGAGQMMLNPITALLLLITALAIIVAFFIIGLEVFIVNIEFSVVAALGLILIPFGAWDKTAFIFDKIKEGIINFGIKYMVMAFIVSTTAKIVNQWSPLANNCTWQQAIYMAFGACALAYVCHHMPSVASSMASGSGGGGLGSGVGMAGTVAGAVAGGTAVATKVALDNTLGKVDPRTGERAGNSLRNSIQGRMNKTTGERVGGLLGRGGTLDKMTGMDVKRDLADFELMQEAQRSINDPTYRSPMSEITTDFRGQTMSQLDKGKLLYQEKNPPKWSGVDRDAGSNRNEGSPDSQTKKK